jgi:hypothetical protein
LRDDADDALDYRRVIDRFILTERIAEPDAPGESHELIRGARFPLRRFGEFQIRLDDAVRIGIARLRRHDRLIRSEAELGLSGTDEARIQRALAVSGILQRTIADGDDEILGLGQIPRGQVLIELSLLCRAQRSGLCDCFASSEGVADGDQRAGQPKLPHGFPRGASNRCGADDGTVIRSFQVICRQVTDSLSTRGYRHCNCAQNPGALVQFTRQGEEEKRCLRMPYSYVYRL